MIDLSPQQPMDIITRTKQQIKYHALVLGLKFDESEIVSATSDGSTFVFLRSIKETVAVDYDYENVYDEEIDEPIISWEERNRPIVFMEAFRSSHFAIPSTYKPVIMFPDLFIEIKDDTPVS